MAANATEKRQNIIQRMTRSILDMRGEMKRVVWPGKKQTLNNTLIVVIFMVIMALIVGLFDTGLSALIRLFFGVS